MFIVFNAGVIAVALLALLLMSPILIMWKFNMVEDDTVFVLGSWCLCFASILGVKLDFKDRIFFFIPTWVITLPTAIYVSYTFSGKVIGIGLNIFLVFLLIIVVIILLAYLSIFFSEKKKNKNLQIQEIVLPNKNEGLLNYWKGIKELFYFPLFYKLTPEIIEYNIGILKLLKENNEAINHSQELLSELQSLKLGLIIGETQKIDSTIKANFFAEIDHQIKTWQTD
jgi:hypothetical protein